MIIILSMLKNIFLFTIVIVTIRYKYLSQKSNSLSNIINIVKNEINFIDWSKTNTMDTTDTMGITNTNYHDKFNHIDLSQCNCNQNYVYNYDDVELNNKIKNIILIEFKKIRYDLKNAMINKIVSMVIGFTLGYMLKSLFVLVC